MVRLCNDKLAEANEWRLPQSLPDESNDSGLPPGVGLATESQKRYGFLDAYLGYFTYVRQVANDVNELGDRAETITENERAELRIAHEETKWDEEYYL